MVQRIGMAGRLWKKTQGNTISTNSYF